jgi:hypothetical protein
MNTLLSSTIALLLGTVITVNGVVVNSEDLVASAKEAANGANLHQIATVLEVYYSDHDSYPTVSDAEALINLFENEGYILNRPLDPNVFAYEATIGGQNYKLSIQ